MKLYDLNKMNKVIIEIIKSFNLGALKEDPIVIDGGITNSLYKVVTDKNNYVIKIVNNSRIKQDNNLIKKLEFSEKIANKAKLNGINSVVAVKINDKYINQYKNNYFLIYEWCEGKVLLSKEITNKHLKIIAKAMSNLHKIKVEEKNSIIKYQRINYNYYFDLLKNNEEEYALFFKNNFNKLLSIYDHVYENYTMLSNQLSYVHKDLNRKNIIWNNDDYYIIDWETATISNPSLDFFNSSWFLTEDIKEEKYKTFTKEYLLTCKLEDNLNVSINCSIIEECMWLEFSLKRALSISTKDFDEIELGKKSIESSIKEIINYYEKIPLMIKYLEMDRFQFKKIT